jgi:hypothetical protein
MQICTSWGSWKCGRFCNVALTRSGAGVGSGGMGCRSGQSDGPIDSHVT